MVSLLNGETACTQAIRQGKSLAHLESKGQCGWSLLMEEESSLADWGCGHKPSLKGHEGHAKHLFCFYVFKHNGYI